MTEPIKYKADGHHALYIDPSEKNKGLNITTEQLLDIARTMSAKEFKEFIKSQPETNIWRNLVLSAVKEINAIASAGQNIDNGRTNFDSNMMSLSQLVLQYYDNNEIKNEYVKTGLQNASAYKSGVVNLERKLAGKEHVVQAALNNHILSQLKQNG